LVVAHEIIVQEKPWKFLRNASAPLAISSTRRQVTSRTFSPTISTLLTR